MDELNRLAWIWGSNRRWPRGRGVVSSFRRWAPLTGQIALAAVLQGIFCSSGWLEAAEFDQRFGREFHPVPAETNPLADPAALAQALSRLLGPAESPSEAGLRRSFLRVGAGLDGGEGARPAPGGRTRPDT